jgi:hypothetical protein
MLNDGVAKMSEDLRPRWLALAYEKIREIGCFVQAVQRFSADCKISEHPPAFFRRYDLAKTGSGLIPCERLPRA